MFAPRRRPGNGNARGGQSSAGPRHPQGKRPNSSGGRFRARPSGPPRYSKPVSAAPRMDAVAPPRSTESSAASRQTSNEPLRLQKVLAHAGIGSRRACEELILQGRVTVDGETIRELGHKVDPAKSKVAVDGQKISAEKLVYFAVNKPKGYLSTNEDPAGRPRVLDLLPEVPQRVYTIGRLDEASVGLILVTNDGELANKLAHPKYGVEKLYRATLAGLPGPEITQQLTEGVWLAEGKVRAKRARIIARRGQSTIMDIVLAEGKNREIRRMLARFGHKVMNLTRMAIGPIVVKGLATGGVRALTRSEVETLHKIGNGKIPGTVAAFKPFEKVGEFKTRRPGPRSQSGSANQASPPQGPRQSADFREKKDFKGRPPFKPSGRDQDRGPSHGPDRSRDQNRPAFRNPREGRDAQRVDGQDRRPPRPFAKPNGDRQPSRPFVKPTGERPPGRPMSTNQGQGPDSRERPRPSGPPPSGPKRDVREERSQLSGPPTGPRAGGPPSGPKSGGPPSGPSRPRPDARERPRPSSGPPRPADRNRGNQSSFRRDRDEVRPRLPGQRGPVSSNPPFRSNPASKSKPPAKPLDGATPNRKIIGLAPEEREAFDLAALPASERRKRLKLQSADVKVGPRTRPGSSSKFLKKPRKTGRPNFKADRPNKPGSQPDVS